MKILSLILSIVLIISVAFQNCSNDSVSFNQRTEGQIAADNNDANGDFGTGGGGFNCVPGQRLSIYIDPNSSGVISKDNYLGGIVTYSGTETAAENYNYYSASAHPNIGPTPTGFEANVFFYDGADGLALNFFANIDEGGSADNIVDMDISVSGNTSNDRVLLSDDNNELKEVSQSEYEARFHYWNNTDGGVIGPFNKNDKFVIRVKFRSSGDITSARFYSANNFQFSLSSALSDISSFIIANEDYIDCK